MTVPNPRVSIVIPNWNGIPHLPECLDSLRRQTFQDFDLIVVDNASTDSSVRWLEEHEPRAQIVRREVNGGFSACANSGIRVARGEYIALLMNDTAPAPEWLGSLVDALDSTGYDSAASRLVFYDSPDTVNAAGDVYAMRRYAGHQRGRGEPTTGFLEEVRVLGACAGAAMYRRSFFDDVGLFDEDFFMVQEDTDLNLRAFIAGKRCVYAPSAVIRHKDSATIRTVPELPEYVVRNQFRVIGKDMPLVLLPLVAVFWAFDSFRDVMPLRPKKWPLVPGLLRRFRGRASLQAEGFRLGWRKRSDVWKRRMVSRRKVVRWLFNGVGPV